MTLIDTNVIIDITDRDAVWFEWSMARLADAGAEGGQVNSVVIAELSRNYASYAELRSELHELGINLLALDEASAFLGGKRFQAFRKDRDRGDDARVLPDFLIGAQALTLGLPLLTRDPRLYRRYFPELPLITPETEHG